MISMIFGSSRSAGLMMRQFDFSGANVWQKIKSFIAWTAKKGGIKPSLFKCKKIIDKTLILSYIFL
jgi:hypothetical protein